MPKNNTELEWCPKPFEWLPSVTDENGPLCMSTWLPNNVLFVIQRGYNATTPWICSMGSRGTYMLKGIDPSDTSKENWEKAIKMAVEHFSGKIQESIQALQAELNSVTALLPDNTNNLNT